MDGMQQVLAGAAAIAIAGIATGACAGETISSKPTQNMSCSGGVCTPTAPKAVLNATDLTNMLASGDVKVTTGAGATNIVVNAAIGWTSTSRLTLDANQSVEIDKPVMVTGTGAVTITTNDGGTGGDLIFDGKGNVTFWDLQSSLIVNGNGYTLVGDIATLASATANNPAGFYALANDYDAKHEKFDSVPVPTIFSGIFEGLNHTIVHLKIKRGTWIKIGSIIEHDEGFFAYVSETGTVRDFGLRKASISSTKELQVGTIAGNNVGSIMSVTVDANVQAASVAGETVLVGGLVGRSDGSVIHSNSASTVIGGDKSVVGGLVGGNGRGKIVYSQSAGSVSAGSKSSVGGLAGSSYSTSLSYSSASVSAGENSRAGGLLGFGNGVSQSYATGAVQAAAPGVTAGGLAGEGYNITDSYATGAVQGGDSSFVGGLVGKGGVISTSYSIGAPAGTSVGGLIGTESGGHLQQAYWDTDTAGTDIGCGFGRCKGAVGLATEEFQSDLPPGFDPEVWAETADTNGGFPYLELLPPK